MAMSEEQLNEKNRNKSKIFLDLSTISSAEKEYIESKTGQKYPEGLVYLSVDKDLKFYFSFFPMSKKSKSTFGRFIQAHFLSELERNDVRSIKECCEALMRAVESKDYERALFLQHEIGQHLIKTDFPAL